MSKYVRQLRYYSENHPNNYPTEGEDVINHSRLSSEKFFTPYMPIIQLGIQTLPGTKFYLNDSERLHPIIVGYTGLYELNLEGIAEINSLAFDPNSIETIRTTQDSYLIIDLVSEKE